MPTVQEVGQRITMIVIASINETIVVDTRRAEWFNKGAISTEERKNTHTNPNMRNVRKGGDVEARVPDMQHRDKDGGR